MTVATKSILKNMSVLHWLLVMGVVVTAALLTGCGSTKVYTADKTIVYKDAVFNVSNVKKFSPKNEAILADKSSVDLKNMDKKSFSALLDKEKPVFVRQSIMLDSDEMVYQATNVSSWSDLDKMNKRFVSAQKSLTKFLGDKKKTQLKLK